MSEAINSDARAAGYFEHVLDVCRCAILSGDEASKHQVRRLAEFLESDGETSKAGELQKLLDSAAMNVSEFPRRLGRSRAKAEGLGGRVFFGQPLLTMDHNRFRQEMSHD